MYLTESGGVKFGFFGLTKMAQRFFQNGEVIQSTDPRVYEGDVLSLGVLLMELFNYYYAYFENSECICLSDEFYFFVSQCLFSDVKKSVVKRLMAVSVVTMNDQ